MSLNEAGPKQSVITTCSRVLEVLVDAAEAGAPCPGNAQIAEQLGYPYELAVIQAVKTLERLGMIGVERTRRYRRVTIRHTGKATAPIPVPQRSPVKTKPAPGPALASAPPPLATPPTPAPPAPERLPSSAPTAGLSMMRNVGPARTCQYPVSDDRPWRFCARRSLPGFSYCASHKARCYLGTSSLRK